MTDTLSQLVPLEAEVAIVGGGVIGSFVALAAAKRGFDVLVIDHAPGLGASAGNAGLVVPSYCTPMSTPQNLVAGLRGWFHPQKTFELARPLSPQSVLWLGRFAAACRSGKAARTTTELLKLAAGSRALYDSLADEGLDLGLRSSGWLWAYESAAALHRAQATADELSRRGLRCEVVSSGEACEIEPGLSPEIAGGLWFPDEGTLDPQQATAAVLAAAQGQGVTVLPEVVREVVAEGGAPRAVRTQQSEIRAKWFVLATGARSRDTAAMFGVRLEVEPGYGWSLTIPDELGTFHAALMSAERHVVLSAAAGRIRITGGMRFGGRPEDQPTPASLAFLRSAAEKLVPAIRALPDGEPWIGARPMTASGRPYMGKLGALPNVFAATGHGTLGMTLAPITGERVGDELVRAREAAP